MEYLQTISTIAQVFFVLLGLYMLYIDKTNKKANTILKSVYDAYQQVRKLDLIGDIKPDDRLGKGLELVQEILYSDSKIDMTTEIKKLATREFATLHAKDKSDKITMNSVAVEKKSGG